MADFNIKGQVQVDDKGSLKKVGKNAKDTADSFDRLEKSQNAHNKREKGVAGITSNSTKAFSKMTTGIRGGLVPAYAVLAANIFALTAAFNALRRAAQVEDLARGLQFMGNVAGRDLKTAAERIRDVTGAAVSMGEAMRTTAVGISAGFRTDQLEQLAKVAKGASIALGRDMGDALDRLTRGVAKLEPEILDELGILVRLDEAAEKYAAMLNVSVNSLSRFQRQQAFLNDTIEQGTKKYGDIAEQLDPNAYDQLAAAAGNLSNSFLNLLNNTLKLGAVVESLSKNNTALLASTSLLGAGIARQLAPGMFQAAQRSADAARAFRDQSVETAKGIKISGQYGTVMAGLATKIQEGEDSSAEFIKAQKLVGSQIKRNETIEQRYQKQLELGIGNQQKIQANLERTQQRLGALRQGQQELTQVEEARLVSTRQQLKANSLAQAQSGNLVGAFRSLNQSIALTNASTAASTARTGKLIKGLRRLRNGALRTAGAFKILGTSFLSFLPLIGLIVTGVSLLWETFKKQPSESEAALQQVTATLENLKNINDQFIENTSTGAERTVNAYITMSGVIQDVTANLIKLASVESEQAKRARIRTQLELSEIENKIKKYEDMRAILENTSQEERNAKAIELSGGDTGDAQLLMESMLTRGVTAEEMSLQTRLAKLNNQLDADREGEQRERLLNTKVYIKGVLEEFDKLSQTDKGFVKEVGDTEVGKVKDALRQILETGAIQIGKESKSLLDLTEEEIAKGLEATLGKAAANILNTADVFQTAEDLASQANSQISKATQKQKREYDDLIGSLEAVIGQQESLAKEGKKAAQGQQQALNVTSEYAKIIKRLNLDDAFKEPGGLQKLVDLLNAGTHGAEELRTNALKLKTGLARLNQEASKSGVANIKGIQMAVEMEAQKLAIQAEQQAIEAARALLRSNNEDDQLKGSQALDQAERRLAKLRADEIKEEDIIYQKEVDRLAIAKENLKVEAAQINLRLKVSEVEQKIANFRAGRGFGLTPEQQYKLEIETAKQKLHIIEREAEIAILILEAERGRLAIQYEQSGAVGALADAQEAVLDTLDAQINRQRELLGLKIESAKTDIKAAKFAGGASVFSVLGISNPLDYLDKLKLAGARLEEIKKDSEVKTSNNAIAGNINLGAGMETADGSSSGIFSQDSIISPENMGIQIIADTEESVALLKASILDLTATAMAPFIESLSSLGPEGEMAAGLANTSLIIQSGMLAIAETAESSAERMAVGFAMAGAVIGQIGNIMNSASQARIDAIDKEIEAEKKRDGKSAKSKAKIKQLEGKAEKEKRKAFERDKKIKMAQTVANTAAAVMGVISTTTGWDLPARIAMAAVVGAMGAAQLAIISGTSYDGGGSGGGGGGLSSVSVGGDRANSVNLARATSPAGEMAYMRGQQGVGNMTNFRPGGFTGRRYMAFGGYTGFMVGEQGPEMFFPDRPGTVMPADDTAEMTGGSTNVNFTINTIDSQGVEDFIFANRGGMIEAIREAANSHGEAFLEGVDVLQDRDRATRFRGG